MAKALRVALVSPAQLRDWRVKHMARQVEIQARDAAEERRRANDAWQDQQLRRWRAGVAVVEANNLHGANQTEPSYPGLYWPF